MVEIITWRIRGDSGDKKAFGKITIFTDLSWFSFIFLKEKFLKISWNRIHGITDPLIIIKLKDYYQGISDFFIFFNIFN